MADHPLVPPHVRDYIFKHKIQENLNSALNHILYTLPQDPLSSMAVKLIESNPVPPQIERLEANETYLCDLS